MMKVLLLNGSANRKGNTFTALSEIAKQLEKNGVESEIIANGITFLRATVLHHPTGAIVQFVIENMDKGGKWMYEHQKGKGFH